MDRSEVITLVKTTQTQNAFGVWEETKTSHDVFCQVNSVTRSEFFEGGRNGLNPEFRFTIFFGDYDGERECIYNGKPYSIYRTYHAKTDALELYVERKGGVNNVSED
jgi:hypothetical protein